MSRQEDNRLEGAIDAIHGQLEARIKGTMTAMRSEKAPGKKTIPAQQQLRAYLKMREDKNAWAEIIQKRGIKGALKYRKAMEKLLKKTMEKVEKRLGEEADIPGFDEGYTPLNAPELPVTPDTLGIEQGAAPNGGI